MDSGTTQRMTCYVSGVHSGPNPSPGLGVAQSLRQAFSAARLVAVDYSVESSGLHSEVFDELWVQRPWRELRLDVYAAAIQEVLDGGALWFGGQDLEVEWLTRALRYPSRAFVPPAQSLQQVAKPFIRAAAGLPLVVPDFVTVDRADWDLHAFCREHGWRVWVKGPNYEAMRVRDSPSFRFAWSTMSETWGTEQIFVQRHVLGSEESVALCAYRGELLDCVHLTKHTQTHEGKTWAGRVSQVDPALVEPLREVIAELEWTGGAEPEYVRSADGTLNLIDWNPRFPAWIHAASFSGHNARRLEAVRTGAEPRLESRKARPAPAVPAALQSDLDEAVLGELPTPRRVLLPRTARQRFAQVEHALAAQTVSGVELGFGYSVKTNPHPSLLALARGAGMFAEVISTAEMRQALAAGFTPDQIVLNGPAQQWPSLPALDGPLIAAFADSPQSLARWIGEGPPQARYLGLRVRPVTLDTSRFGTSFARPKDFARILGLLRELPSAQEVGLHFHLASDVIGPTRWHEVYEEIIHWASAIQEGIGRPVRCLDVGGGWFPDDFDREMLPRLDGLVGAAADLLPRLERFFVEPGKAMAQPTMALVTTVLEVRRGRKGTTEAVVDAAISDLPMAPFYPHRVYGRSANGSWEALGGRGDRLVGRICMETDILATDLALPDSLEVGQQLVIGDAGAYDASMAYNFGRGVLDDVCC